MFAGSSIDTQAASTTAAVEVWTPTGGDRITCTAGVYGGPGAEALRLASEGMTFSGGEGLPGAVLARGVPVLLDELDDESFPRRSVAGEAGVVAALGVPIFDEDQLVSVVLFLFRGGPERVGAVELWAGQRGRMELGLSKAFYGGLGRFARLSRHVNFPMGAGLPGFVWENKCPKAVNNLAGSAGFLRSSGAETAGLAAGFGFPVCFQNELRAVMLWLSTAATPLARLHEVWLSEDGGGLRFGGGAALGRPGLLDPETAADAVPAVAEVMSTKRPVLIADPAALGAHREEAARAAGIASGVAMPVLVLGRLRAVAVLAW